MIKSLCLFLTLAFLAVSVPLPARDVPSETDAAALIRDYDLEVAETPVRERPDWRSPERIVILESDPGRLQ